MTLFTVLYFIYMVQTDKLPKIVSKKKKIDLKKFVPLAKRVQKIFKEEAEYFEKYSQKNESYPGRGILASS